MIQNDQKIVIKGNIKIIYDFLMNLNQSQYSECLIAGKPGTGKTYICKYFSKLNNTSNLYFNCCNEFQQDFDSNYLLEIQQIKNKIVFFDELEYFSFVKLEKYYKFLEIIKICQEYQHKIVFITQSPEKLETFSQRIPYQKVLLIELPDINFRREFFLSIDGKYQFLDELTNYFSISDLVNLISTIQMEPLKQITKWKYFNKIDGKYKEVEQFDDGAIQMTNNEIQNILPEIELTKNEIRKIVANMKPSSYLI